MSDKPRPFVIPETGIYLINGSYRLEDATQPGLERGFRQEWVELVKGRSWDDPEAELIDLRIIGDGAP